MFSKTTLFGIGIAFILPLLVYYGVNALHPGPEYASYNIDYNRYHNASDAEKTKLDKEEKELRSTYDELATEQARLLFYVAVPVGILAILIGYFLKAPGIAPGLIGGGLFSTVLGYCSYWEYLPDLFRFFSLLVVFILLLILGLKATKKA
jgi:hypothetical protein